MKYILSVTEDIPNYGFKARVDILDILKKNGYKEIYIKSHYDSSMKNLIFDLKSNKKQLLKFLKNMKKNSQIVMQYPWNSMTLYFAKNIKKYCKKKSCTSIIIVHDINSLRTNNKFGRIYFNYVVKEYKFMNCFDKIICHNNSMKELLVNNGITKEKIICLNLFDYLSSFKNKVESNNFKIVNIAGNLNRNKAGYVYRLSELKNQNSKYNLYGVNYDGINEGFISFKGSFDPVSLIRELKNGFGLVWDGDSTMSCTGSFGEYLKINNPHKLSLYMAAGMPVIVWRESAIAEFVLKNKVGFVVSSINQIDDIFANMTDDEYELYLKNVKKIQSKVLKGDFILNALKIKEN